MIVRTLVAISLCVSVFTTLFAAELPRQHINFDDDWRFLQEDVKGVEEPAFDDSAWRKLTLPHDWSIEGEYRKSNPMGGSCGYLPAGIGCYRKTINVPKEWKGKTVEVAFDGVFMNSTVWANGRKIGFRPFGWISFAYDISKEVAASDTITFAVRVDNSLQPSARWYTGSGIYAHTWLTIKDPVHIKTDGIFVRTKGETVAIDTEAVNTTGKLQELIVRSTISDKDGNVVQTVETPLVLKENETKSTAQTCTIKEARRWSLDTPHLYTLNSEIVRSNRVLDNHSTTFGVRDIEWVKETGLKINGKDIKMRGVCNHQDAGPLGAAVPDKILRFRIQQLKDMGCNAIRTAHNPQTPEFYQYCDEIGMLVMDEIFDGWTRKAGQDYGAQAFAKWWRKDLEDWMKRDRNHASIIIWSVGNETRGEVAEDIVALCHKIDPTRPVTSGHSGTKCMDIPGYNGNSERQGFFENNKELLIGTENTHTWQVRGY